VKVVQIQLEPRWDVVCQHGQAVAIGTSPANRLKMCGPTLIVRVRHGLAIRADALCVFRPLLHNAFISRSHNISVLAMAPLICSRMLAG